MFAIWWFIALITAVLFALLEWRLWRTGLKRIYAGETALLPGKRWYYVAGAFTVAFVGVTAFYFGLISFVEAEISGVCWLIPALTVGILNTLSVLNRLRYFEFSN